MAVTLPHLTVAGAADYVGGESFIVLPALTVQGFGGPTIQLPMFTVAGVGYTGEVGSGRITLPALEVAGAGQNAIQLPKLTVTGVGRTGDLTGSATIELPLLTVDGAGYQHQIGTASITLPMLRIIGAASTALPAADTTAGAAGTGTGKQFVAGEALVLNLKNSAASTYTNFGFNSFATFNGVMLAANAAGIFALAGESDNGTGIDATVRLGVTEFGDSRMKRVPRAYVGYRTNGECVLRVSVDEGEWFEYALEDRDVEGIHATRVKVGKGLKGRYWQAEVANVEGATLDLDSLELVPVVLSRRIA